MGPDRSVPLQAASHYSASARAMRGLERGCPRAAEETGVLGKVWWLHEASSSPTPHVRLPSSSPAVPVWSGQRESDFPDVATPLCWALALNLKDILWGFGFLIPQ